MEKIKERLRKFISENGGNTAEIARQMGIAETYLGAVLSKGDKGLSATMIVGVANAGFDVQWLLTGGSCINKLEDKIILLESELKDAKNLIKSLERILKGGG